MLYLLFLLKWLCSIQKVYFDVKKATFFLSATVDPMRFTFDSYSETPCILLNVDHVVITLIWVLR